MITMRVRRPFSPAAPDRCRRGRRAHLASLGAMGPYAAEEYGWEGALATIVPDESPEQLHPGVFVALYDLSPGDEKALDAWEGADSGLYRRVHLRVHTLTGDVVAFVYVLDAFEGGLPSARHRGAIADAAEHAGAPTDYVTALRSRECRTAF